MFSLLFSLFLAQANPNSSPTPPQEFVQPQEVRPLPGQLDSIPVFNSNSPELVQEEGILLSTFPPTGKTHPAAHLNFPFQGFFDVFAHHVAKAPAPEELRSLYLGILLHNPGSEAVTVNVLEAATYLSQPEAPFIELPDQVDNSRLNTYAGPGSRVTNDILWERHQKLFPAQIVIPPQQSRMLLNLPIPVRSLDPPINGRSTYIRLHSDGKIYAASLGMYAPTDQQGNERSPTLEEWQQLLEQGSLAGPRDRAPTPLNYQGSLIYGRVAGVSLGRSWKATLTDHSNSAYLTIPAQGEAFSYGLSTLNQNTLGTRQVQSAPMLVRYPDTAYRAHGNYGVHYSLTLPLINPTNKTQTVTVAIQTPLKQDQIAEGLRFLKPPGEEVFFRGTVQIRYSDAQRLPRTRSFHLVQRRGQPGKELVKLVMPPQDRRLVSVDFVYPPDATPPQVLTVNTR